MFEYFILRLEDKFERLFDTRLQSIQPGEVDEFRQPRFFFNIDFKYITSRGRSGSILSVKNFLPA